MKFMLRYLVLILSILHYPFKTIYVKRIICILRYFYPIFFLTHSIFLSLHIAESFVIKEFENLYFAESTKRS